MEYCSTFTLHGYILSSIFLATNKQEMMIASDQLTDPHGAESFFEKPSVAHLPKNFQAFHGTQSFIAVFIRALLVFLFTAG
jgi:hypothetical protein